MPTPASSEQQESLKPRKNSKSTNDRTKANSRSNLFTFPCGNDERVTKICFAPSISGLRSSVDISVQLVPRRTGVSHIMPRASNAPLHHKTAACWQVFWLHNGLSFNMRLLHCENHFACDPPKITCKVHHMTSHILITCMLYYNVSTQFRNWNTLHILKTIAELISIGAVAVMVWPTDLMT